MLHGYLHREYEHPPRGGREGEERERGRGEGGRERKGEGKMEERTGKG